MTTEQTQTAGQTTAQATAQAITPQLRQWIVEQAQAGCTPESVLKAMRDAGWQESVAMQAMEESLASHLRGQGLQLPAVATSDDEAQAAAAQAAAQAALPALRVGRPMPHPPLGDCQLVLDVGDRQVKVVSVMRMPPYITVFDSFFSPEECAQLIALAEPRMARSRTVSEDATAEEFNANRTSDGMFFQRGEHPFVAMLERRMARLMNWPYDNGEGLQVLHYGKGAEYKPHYDYFDRAKAGTSTILTRGGQRLGTLLVYLSEPPRGGGTVFPDVGIEVTPRLGTAVFFSYEMDDPSSKSLHGGSPVIEGDKWVCTKWVREGFFR
jgi:prolyl 4-hydroxylase